MGPNKIIRDLVGSRIKVEMKGEKCVLEGILANIDNYLNLCLADTLEIVDGEKSRFLGNVILRGNNIILINFLDGIR